MIIKKTFEVVFANSTINDDLLSTYLKFYLPSHRVTNCLLRQLCVLFSGWKIILKQLFYETALNNQLIFRRSSRIIVLLNTVLLNTTTNYFSPANIYLKINCV